MSVTDPINEFIERHGEQDAPAKLCRGCAGRGLGQHLSPRQIQMVQGAFWLHRETGRDRCVQITATVEHARGSYKGPLALILAVLDALHAEGYEEAPEGHPLYSPIPFSGDWRCEWCGGTGRPSLSAHTLELLVRKDP